MTIAFMYGLPSCRPFPNRKAPVQENHGTTNGPPYLFRGSGKATPSGTWRAAAIMGRSAQNGLFQPVFIAITDRMTDLVRPRNVSAVI